MSRENMYFGTAAKKIADSAKSPPDFRVQSAYFTEYERNGRNTGKRVDRVTDR